MSQKVVKSEQQEADEQKEREECERVGKKVMRALGRPPGFVEVKVRRVRQGTYRVNVLVEKAGKADLLDVFQKEIGHSFFVRETHPEFELESDPPIKKLY